jgi:hypothetical protein
MFACPGSDSYAIVTIMTSPALLSSHQTFCTITLPSFPDLQYVWYRRIVPSKPPVPNYTRMICEAQLTFFNPRLGLGVPESVVSFPWRAPSAAFFLVVMNKR